MQNAKKSFHKADIRVALRESSDAVSAYRQTPSQNGPLNKSSRRNLRIG
jgi:hypothetical protein